MILEHLLRAPELPGTRYLAPAIEPVQLLNKDGQRRTHPDYHYSGTDSDLADALRHMLMSRRFDTEATWLQRKGELALWPPNLGQEAAQIGSWAATLPGDKIVPSYREHAIALAVGIDPIDLLSPFRGTTMISWDTQKLHPYSFVIGSQTLHATGLAQALTLDQLGPTTPAVICYFGDGATSQGDVLEAFNFAAVARAPIVFFCQNNQWAISTPNTKQFRGALCDRATGFGFPGVQVDGNDVLAVHAVTEWALDRARTGCGPTLIEAFTYRMGAHTTSDDPSKYRSSAESDYWAERDPISRLTSYLTTNGTIDAAWQAEVATQADALAHRVRTEVPQLKPPNFADFFDLVYTETPSHLQNQRQRYLDFEASFGSPRA